MYFKYLILRQKNFIIRSKWNSRHGIMKAIHSVHLHELPTDTCTYDYINYPP